MPRFAIALFLLIVSITSALAAPVVLRRGNVAEPETLDPQKYQAQVEFMTPATGTADKVVVTAKPQENGASIATLEDTDTSGIYEVQLTANDNTQQVTAYAYNVDAAEGDLSTIGSQQLASELKDVSYEFHNAADLYFDSKELQGFNLSKSLLFALIFLLIAEQLLAYSVSYHPAKVQGGS